MYPFVERAASGVWRRLAGLTLSRKDPHDRPFRQNERVDQARAYRADGTRAFRGDLGEADRRRIGGGAATFYAYFEDKQDLLESIETELLEDLSLYRSRRSLAPTENPFDDMCKWYRTCYAWDRALRALTGPNGDPRFAGRLIAKASAELHDMMDDEGVPRDNMRPYFETMLGHSYVGLALYAIRAPQSERLDPMRLAQIANHTRAAFFRGNDWAPRLSDEQLFGEAGEIL